MAPEMGDGLVPEQLQGIQAALHSNPTDSEHSPSSDNAIPRSDSDARSNMVAAEALTALSAAVDPAITGLRRKADVAMPGPPNKRTTSAFKELPRPAAESVVRPAARRAMGNAQPLHVPLPLHLPASITANGGAVRRL